MNIMHLKKDTNINFLIYDNRSGSTYLSALLDSFEEIGVSLESPILFNLLTGKPIYKNESEINNTLNYIYADQKFRDWDIPEQPLKNRLINNLPLTKGDLIYFILENYFSLKKPNSKCWIYKNSSPYLIKRIKCTFPAAKFIFIYRDGRAVFCSKKRSISLNTGDVMENDPILAARTWSRHINIVDKTTIDCDIAKVKYENLIRNTEKELKKLYQFLIGVEPTERLLNIDPTSYYKKIPSSQAYLHKNVGKKPLMSRIDGWKNEISKKEGYLYEKEAYITLKKMRYEIYFYNKRYPERFNKELYLYTIKLFFQRGIRKFERLLFLISRPTYAWKKVITKFETKF